MSRKFPRRSGPSFRITCSNPKIRTKNKLTCSSNQKFEMGQENVQPTTTRRLRMLYSNVTQTPIITPTVSSQDLQKLWFGIIKIYQIALF
jgi:hypothetical protein